MNKFINTLIITNGILIPVALVWFFVDRYSYYWSGDEFEPQSIIVGDELEKAKMDSVALQGLIYDAPRDVYNSTNKYLPVAAMTYKQAKSYKRDLDSQGDISIGDPIYFNVVFMDKDYHVTGLLLDRRAAVNNIFFSRPYHNHMDYYDDSDPVDTTVKNIAYDIAFEDSNNDGKINYQDDYDLYISDLDGRNLTQVTKQIDVLSYEFIDSNSRIFVSFQDRSDMRDEYKQTKFGVYNIKGKTFSELTDIESELSKIESSLIR